LRRSSTTRKKCRTGKRGITRRQAVQIARQACIPDASQFTAYGSKPENLNIGGIPSEPCWFVYVPKMDFRGQGILRSSRVILVSKSSGKILYDGSARDEG